MSATSRCCAPTSTATSSAAANGYRPGGRRPRRRRRSGHRRRHRCSKAIPAQPGQRSASAVLTGHAFLDDIAHAAVPVARSRRRPRRPTVIRRSATRNADGNDRPRQPRGTKTAYDNELLDAPLHHRRRPRQREHRPDRRSTTSSTPSTTASSSRSRSSPSTSGDLAFLNEWLLVDVTAVPTTAEAEGRPRLGRRAPVPGRPLHHRDGVPAPGVRGIRPQDAARRRRLRVRAVGRHQPGDLRRVRPVGLPLRPLDAATRTSTSIDLDATASRSQMNRCSTASSTRSPVRPMRRHVRSTMKRRPARSSAA